ncbi:hypothetical protein HETIRDRAFT_415213 [Heterobasidion irregulare TC 32-1]|uniref:Uncharacterized protein n=1 Tax=Heterobasidion irregulare (strain TC 32-1) TaxID=747525 RepID=W4KK70_HETIT|nr:uncharacterized protein HETIRDRAFT_415213 [Heterobasidion irregulare TC 32-1]ETW86258.1 hypothetical protein HETIRDRAFT_415213 [Heterobasidion irregulare TC 32-1]
MSPTFEYDVPMRSSPSPIFPSNKRLSTYSSHPGKYSPSSRAADISRLLDPSYSSSSSSSSPTSVYVDHQGDLHDPDYRDFPAVHARDLASRRRPTWERYNDDDHEPFTTQDEDAYAYDADAFDERARLRAAARDIRRRSHEPPRRATTIPSYNHYQYSRSPFNDDASTPTEIKEKRVRRKLRSKSETRRESAWFVEEEYESPAMLEEEPQTKSEYTPTRTETPEWTPTCGQQFRRQWQALSLSLRFTIFRAQRKLRRKIHSST